MVACDDRAVPMRKPGYISPPDPRETARKQFSQLLIAALEDAQAGQAMRDGDAGAAASIKRAASKAYDAMQFDFPVSSTLPRLFQTRSSILVVVDISGVWRRVDRYYALRGAPRMVTQLLAAHEVVQSCRLPRPQ